MATTCTVPLTLEALHSAHTHITYMLRMIHRVNRDYLPEHY